MLKTNHFVTVVLLSFNPLINCTAQAVTTVTTITEYMTLGAFVVNRETLLTVLERGTSETECLPSGEGLHDAPIHNRRQCSREQEKE